MVLLTRSNVISVVESMSLTKLYHDMAADIDMRNTNNLRLTYFCTKLMFRCTSSTTIFSRLVYNASKKDYYIPCLQNVSRTYCFGIQLCIVSNILVINTQNFAIFKLLVDKGASHSSYDIPPQEKFKSLKGKCQKCIYQLEPPFDASLLCL